MPAQNGEHSMMFSHGKFSQTKVVRPENSFTAFLTAYKQTIELYSRLVWSDLYLSFFYSHAAERTFVGRGMVALEQPSLDDEPLIPCQNENVWLCWHHCIGREEGTVKIGDCDLMILWLRWALSLNHGILRVAREKGKVKTRTMIVAVIMMNLSLNHGILSVAREEGKVKIADSRRILSSASKFWPTQSTFLIFHRYYCLKKDVF